MQAHYIDLSLFQVLVAAGLILINGLISLLLGLKLERSLIIGAVRMTVQLMLVGLVLNWVFGIGHWYLVLIMMSIMTAIAGYTAVDRVSVRYPGIRYISMFSVWAGSWVVTALALFFIIQVKPWYTPQYAIPLLGMILGNILNGISLGLERFTHDLESKRAQVETVLTLGGTSWEAARPHVSAAVRAGMVPIINTMMVAGIVTLPGMMTGQLLAGVHPVAAVKYQIVIIFLIAVATGVGTISGVLLSYRRLFNASHQFLHFRLTSSKKS